MGSKVDKKRITVDMFHEIIDGNLGCKKVTMQRSYEKSWENTRSGNDDPMWRSKIANESNATNRLTGKRSTYKISKGLWTYATKKDPSSWYTCMRTNSYSLKANSLAANFSNNVAFWDTALRDEAKNKGLIGIRQKIRAQSTRFSGMVMLGELRETIRLLRSPANAMRIKTGLFADQTQKRIRSMRKRNKTQQSISDTIAESWLEYSFGIVPLMADIQGIAESVKDRLDKGVERISYTGYADSSTNSVKTSWMNPSFFCSFSETLTKKNQAIYTVGYKADIQAANSIDRIIDAGGFNLNEVVPTAWDLIPWSFLIDYFTNIGDVLEASLVALDGVKWAQLTERQVNTLTWHSFSAESHPAYTDFRIEQQPLYVGESRLVERDVASLGYPSLRFELPGSNAQFLNMAALAKLIIFS